MLAVCTAHAPLRMHDCPCTTLPMHCACTCARALRMHCTCMGATCASRHSPSWAVIVCVQTCTTTTHALQALTELGAGATTRRINGGALWNVASLVNVLTALSLFLLPTVDQYYVSHQHWLLPFCLLCTKLLLAQSFKFLAASAGLTSSGWQLLTSLEEMQASRLSGK